MKNKLIRKITCWPYRAHTEPLFYTNKIHIVKDINFCEVSVFMYNQLFVEFIARHVPQAMNSTEWRLEILL